MAPREYLDTLLRKGKISQREAYAFFDSLPSVKPEELTGVWKGTELASGHPLDGVLTAAGWYGKRFSGKEEVYPLLFCKDNTIYPADPGRLPIYLAQMLPKELIRFMGKFIWLLYRTKRSGARVRMMRCRGKLTAVMLYDQKPIIDMFARVDENTLLGVSDTKWNHDLGCFFVLEHVEET